MSFFSLSPLFLFCTSYLQNTRAYIDTEQYSSNNHLKIGNIILYCRDSYNVVSVVVCWR